MKLEITGKRNRRKQPRIRLSKLTTSPASTLLISDNHFEIQQHDGNRVVLADLPYFKI